MKKLLHARLVWGCINKYGTGCIRILETIVNSEICINILENDLAASMDLLYPGQPCYFQHDNAPPHRSKQTKDWLIENGINVIDWPPYSPDLNVIENCWSYISRRVSAIRPTNVLELKKVVLETWLSIPSEYCSKLFDSLPQRIHDVINRKGLRADTS